ncbi:MAG: type I pullulanase [Firmicutes bacterium]|nr:type I pullulanase [Bacillota bacterium]
MDLRTFYSYLDNFDELTIIIPLKNYRDNNHYRLVGNDEWIELTIRQKLNLGVEVKLICSFDAYIDLGKTYYVENEELEQSELYTGKIVRTELFDNIYRYKKTDLGFTYTAESTKFKIWTPVAKSVKLELLNPQNETLMIDMLYTNSGVWRILVMGDLEKYRYRFLALVNGKEQIVSDPYAISSTAFGEYSYVIDKSKLFPMKYSTSFSGDPLDAILYEMNVRDFTIDPKMNFQHKGKFLGVIEKGIKTLEGNPAGFDYLKSIGITHVQLMPIFDFDGVDELNQSTTYNWGYNPQQYNVPEGWYSTNPDDPYARINELRQMIDALHKENINVVMDVVFNHVFDAATFSYELLVPGYSYHVDRDGIYTNVSGCKNDLATDRKMIRKLIIESVLYWVNEYHIDGFRFDLMGLIDVETMNELRQELHSISKHIIVYGEGWKMYSSNLADRMAHMKNKNVIHTIGFFNDTFRETIKGATFLPKDKGYSMGNVQNVDIIKEMLLGSAMNRYLFKYTTQSINYVECHDNLTFFDKAFHLTKDISLIKKWQKLATSFVILSQGVPFIHSGQEFYRTKKGNENSYISSDEINLIDWKLVDENYLDIEYFKQLIQLRKTYSCFKLKSSSELTQHVEVIVLGSKSIMMHLNDDANLILIFKPTIDDETIIIPEGYHLFISSSSKSEKSEECCFTLKDIGTYIFQKESE